MSPTRWVRAFPPGALLWFVSSSSDLRSRRVIRHVLGEHGVQHFDPAPSEAQHRLSVAFAVCPLAIVVRARWWMAQVREGGQEERVLEPMVAVVRGDVGAQRAAGLSGCGSQARIGGQVGWRAEAGDGANLDCATCPEARADARQATQDRRPGEGEKSLA